MEKNIIGNSLLNCYCYLNFDMWFQDNSIERFETTDDKRFLRFHSSISIEKYQI